MNRDRLTGTHRHAGQAGFTIVEVLVAVVIFAVGLLAIAGMQTRSIEQSSFSDQMTMRINAATHWAESMKRMPLIEETIEIDSNNQIDVEINTLYEESNMCGYGGECDWTYIDFEDQTPHRLRQRVTQSYPLPNLVMVELEAIPQGVREYKAKKGTVRIAYVRSTRWN